MKKKSAIAQVLEAAKHGTPSSFLEWVNDNAPFLLDTEKGQIVDAWIEGKAEKVRTPCVNEIIHELCSKSITCAALEIENGNELAPVPVREG